MNDTNNVASNQQLELTMSVDELFALHPLPWTHDLLLIKDANGNQVIHTGGLYSERGRLYEGKYLSGLNALLVGLANSCVSKGEEVARDDPSPAYDGSMTREQLERAALIAENREIDLETAQELVYLRDRVAAIPQSFEEAQLQKIYEDPHPGYDCRGTCVIHSGRFAATVSPAAPKEEAPHKWAERVGRHNNDPLWREITDNVTASRANTPSPDAAREAAKEIWNRIDSDKWLTLPNQFEIEQIIQRHCFKDQK